MSEHRRPESPDELRQAVREGYTRVAQERDATDPSR